VARDLVVGVDVGSGSARAVAIDSDGVVANSARVRYPAVDLPTGEVVPTTWLTGAIGVIEALGVEPTAICFGGQGPTSVAASGELAITFRHPAWASSPPPEQHEAHVEYLRNRFGAQIVPRQLWDWVAAQLGGRTDTQALWPGSPPLTDFGDLIPVGSGVGETDGSHGIPAGITLAAGANDAFLTAWGSGIDTPGKGFDPGGMTGGLGVAVQADDHPDAMIYGMASAVPGVYIVGGPVAAHGAMLDWWAGITGRSLPELLDLAAKVPAGANGVMALPFFEGERAPRWNTALRAEIVGLDLESDVGVITRALLEATAYGIGHIAVDLAANGIVLERLVCSGGPSQSRLWSEIKAAVLDVPVDVTLFPQMSAYGAALGAGAAVGWWPRPGDGAAGDWPEPEMDTIQPEPNDVYRDGLARFIELGDAAQARLD